MQLVDASIRRSAPEVSANPISQILSTIFQSFWGQPLAGSFANSQGFYPEEWVWVGAIAVVLAIGTYFAVQIFSTGGSSLTGPKLASGPVPPRPSLPPPATREPSEAAATTRASSP